MILLMALIFSTGHGATATSGMSTINSHCAPILLKAGAMAAGDLSVESATDQYLKYLIHFYERGYLSLEDLKSVRNFSEMPNLIKLFEEKIPEGFVYHDHIEGLIKSVDHKHINQRLDEVISKEVKILALKEKAKDDTKIVWGHFATPATAKPHPDAIKHGHHFVDSELGLISVDMQGTIHHLETGTQFKTNRKFDTVGPRFLTKINGITYLVRSTTDRPADSTEPRVFQTEIFLVAHEVKTGKLALDLQFSATRVVPTLYLDRQGKLGFAWFFEEIFSPSGNKKWFLIYGADRKNVNEVELFWTADLRTAQLSVTATGEAFALLEYYDQATKKNKLKILDISDDGKPVLSIDSPEELASIKDRYSHVLNFHKNLDGSFTVLFRKGDQLIDVNFAYSPLKQEWLPTKFAFDFPVGGTSPSLLESVPEPDGSYFYIFGGSATDPLLVYKNGVKHPQVFQEVGFISSVLTSSEGAHYLLAQKSAVNPLYFLFKLGTSDLHPIAMESTLFDRAYYEGSRFTPDGRIISFFLPNGAARLKSDLPAYFPLQIYGPYNPKTGEAAP